MKKWLFFSIGVVLGLVMAAVAYFVFLNDKRINNDIDETDIVEVEAEDEEEDAEEDETLQLPDGVTLFDDVGDIVKEKSFKVLQVLWNNCALVFAKDGYGYYGTMYCLTNNDGKYYYDDEIINVPNGKVVRQIGIYRYFTRNETMKTVPIIIILDH